MASINGFQGSGRAWHPRREDVLALLATGRHESTKPIYYGSNHTFLVELDAGDAGRSLAVYKPARGEYPLYDFPAGTLYRREVATYLVDNLLGWDIVPPTVVGQGMYGIGSVQLFIETVSRAEVEVGRLQRIALLDVLINNADRKAEHCLPGLDDNLWGIDHGLTFHSQPKLRTVLWHFAGMPIPEGERADIKRLRQTLQQKDRTTKQLRRLLQPEEYSALTLRTKRLDELGAFPDPRYKPIPYRW